MIRWCSYCQAFMGECAPYEVPTFTHGICTVCDVQLEKGVPLKEDTQARRELFRRILRSGAEGDESVFAEILSEAQQVGLKTDSLLVGMLQPVLYQAGLDWQAARMSVAAEHRLTQWCERVFALLPPARRSQPPLDLLIFQTPGNQHSVGPRFAARTLQARGLAVEALVPSLPLKEMAMLARETRPRFIGFSCAMNPDLAAAIGLISELRDCLIPDLQPRFVLSGLAVRTASEDWRKSLPRGVEAVLDLEFFQKV